MGEQSQTGSFCGTAGVLPRQGVHSAVAVDAAHNDGVCIGLEVRSPAPLQACPVAAPVLSLCDGLGVVRQKPGDGTGTRQSEGDTSATHPAVCRGHVAPTGSAV